MVALARVMGGREQRQLRASLFFVDEFGVLAGVKAKRVASTLYCAFYDDI